MIVLAKLPGDPRLPGVSPGARLHGPWLNEVGHLQRSTWPAASASASVLERLDAQEVTRAIPPCLTRAEPSRRGGEEPSRLAPQAGGQHRAPIAMAGKTMRGALGQEAAHQKSVPLLSRYEVATGIVLAQRAVQTKENESRAAPAFAKPCSFRASLAMPPLQMLDL